MNLSMGFPDVITTFYLLKCFVLAYRDVDETISWIKEKEQLMASDDFGRDLASVQALLRKHEGLERDLAALEDKVSLSLSTNFFFSYFTIQAKSNLYIYSLIVFFFMYIQFNALSVIRPCLSNVQSFFVYDVESCTGSI